MKAFKTVKGAFNHIKNNAQTGNEKELNGALMFGMGIYAYSDIVTYSGVNDCSKSNDVFYHFKNDNEIIHFIQWLQNSDNYLIIA